MNRTAPTGGPENERERVCRAAQRMSAAGTKGSLGAAIAGELLQYSMYDLQLIGGGMKRETDKLPMPYREKIRPYFERQLFGTYHRLLSLHRSGGLATMQEPVSDEATFREYCAMMPEGCFGDTQTSGTDFYFDNPIRSLFYYLVSAGAMFVLDEPGHPEGTPFPGGFVVERRGKEYYCPIRDKEEEVPFSICNFCPAKQMEGV
ncbi:MAG: DUF2115 domain-containing protein [Methanomicrobiales archaeon]|nr:DUF2115 domain-containing protein [Methanomicrobiales archaeon]